MTTGQAGGQKVCFVLPAYDRDSATHVYHHHELVGELRRSLEVAVVYVRGQRTGALRHRRDYVLRSQSRLLRALEAGALTCRLYLQGFRTIYVHYYLPAAVCGSLICMCFGGRTLVWCCAKSDLYFTTLSWRSLVQKVAKDWPIRIMYRLAQGVVACSSHMAEHMRVRFGVPPHRLHIVHNWVNVERFREGRGRTRVRGSLGVSQEAVVVLFVHTLAENKGADRIPDIVERVIAQRPDVTFWIAGDGPLRQKLEREISGRQLSRSVRWFGAVPNVDVGNLMKAADILVNPARIEEFGRILLEAMAAGLPFVSTDGGGGVLAFTTAEQQQYVTDPDDLSEFVERLLRLVRSPAECERLRQVGLGHVRRFTLETARVAFLRLFRNEGAGT